MAEEEMESTQMRAIKNHSFQAVVDAMTLELASAPTVKVGEWQAIKGEIPQGYTIEVEDFSFSVFVPAQVEELQRQFQPNLPWAEDHFQERVSGEPLNPPPSSAWWPFATQNNEAFKADEKFSHTYPERFWPKFAGQRHYNSDGIRYPWGDLSDVVKLLQDRPGTRQAYLPVWFPEDTGSVEGQRVPCTLGYHFMIRDGLLKIVYYIRSCDFYRHFRDDAYMAARLCQWMAHLTNVQPGSLIMHISSLHIFEPERGKIREEADQLKRPAFERSY